ncbi:uncharacterized protein LY89DRAFT_725553 [Mollisia scopiformis]|uniref:N-acetyltransferase domain-containing protein n=1 Tax=Mollisia scopiformis TaxID=149040 RepID=A0A132B5X6_MOLSC|nr:uncharacterized protein LY89DRAFT_725553 [Mollisia scopiformis]KUJ07815.1 hypothetical protein LY89DRAFT_725553 [Mollisia scopiformis]
MSFANGSAEIKGPGWTEAWASIMEVLYCSPASLGRHHRFIPLRPTFPPHTQHLLAPQEVLAFPLYPPLEGNLRLATAAADLPRIADLSVLGFRDSEIFRFERPRYQEFPQDAVAAFSNIYRTQLLDPLAIVVVVEDLRLPEDETGATRQTERVVVGVASWDLPEDSPRKGRASSSCLMWMTPYLSLIAISANVDGSSLLDLVRLQRRRNSICDKLVVHPLYQRRGHATSMLQWFLVLSRHDKIDAGVIPSHMGELLYLALGYEKIDEVPVPDDGDTQGFSQRVLLFHATANK